MTSTTTTPSTPEVFERAADLIERDGLYCGDFWPRQDQPYRSGQPCCCIAALVIAQHPTAEHVPLNWVEDFETDLHVLAFARYLGFGNATSAIAAWSDRHQRDEVVAVLRSAATSLRTQDRGVAA